MAKDSNHEEAAYATLARDGRAEFIEKRSRFIGFAQRVATMHEALAAVETLREGHPGASHVAWACVAGPGGAQRRCSDDGEVSGTAGAPLLNLLDRRGIHGALLAAVRYYGGTKLGSGGLLRAYTRAGIDVLDAAGVARMAFGALFAVECELSAGASVLHRLKLRGAVVDAPVYTERVTIRFWIEGDGAALLAELGNLTAGRAEIHALGTECRAAETEISQ